MYTYKNKIVIDNINWNGKLKLKGKIEIERENRNWKGKQKLKGKFTDPTKS